MSRASSHANKVSLQEERTSGIERDPGSALIEFDAVSPPENFHKHSNESSGEEKSPTMI